MLALLVENKLRGMIAERGAIISGANPIPWEQGGRGRRVTARLPARSRVPANML
jgi:hypothetical protein